MSTTLRELILTVLDVRDNVRYLVAVAQYGEIDIKFENGKVQR